MIVDSCFISPRLPYAWLTKAALSLVQNNTLCTSAYLYTFIGVLEYPFTYWCRWCASGCTWFGCEIYGSCVVFRKQNSILFHVAVKVYRSTSGFKRQAFLQYYHNYYHYYHAMICSRKLYQCLSRGLPLFFSVPLFIIFYFILEL